MALQFLDWLPVGLKTYYDDMKGCAWALTAQLTLMHNCFNTLDMSTAILRQWYHLEPVSAQ